MLLELARGLDSLLFPASVSISKLIPCPRPWSGLPEGKLDGVLSPFLYEGDCREVILGLKYREGLSWAPLLAQRMARQILDQPQLRGLDGLVPVPLHPVRLRERGFNQAQVLCQELSDRLKLPCREDLVSRKYPTPPQAGLKKSQRTLNVKGAFEIACGVQVKKQRLLLVDDVVTTGATAGSIAALLKAAGAEKVFLVTAARD